MVFKKLFKGLAKTREKLTSGLKDLFSLGRNLDDLARIADWLDEHDVGIYLVANGSYYRPGF